MEFVYPDNSPFEPGHTPGRRRRSNDDDHNWSDDVVGHSDGRKKISQIEDIELVAEPEVQGIDERVSYVVKKRKAKNSKSQASTKIPLGLKVLWAICILLFIRLAFMERGLWDYYRAGKEILARGHYLQQLRRENADIRVELKKIKSDLAYQKRMAREHLGVIDKDEYMIIFAGDTQ